jgi:hypothetical protein
METQTNADNRGMDVSPTLFPAPVSSTHVRAEIEFQLSLLRITLPADPQVTEIEQLLSLAAH